VSPLGLEAKLIAGALALAALLGGLAWFVNHERSLGAAAVTAAAADQHAKDVDSARTREAQITTAQGAADHEADRFHLAAALDARDAVDADHRLQQRFAAVNARCVPGNPAAAASGQAASQPDARADTFRMVIEAARQLAADADAEHAAGVVAEKHYDALTAK
jgi:hypothetical protein